MNVTCLRIALGVAVLVLSAGAALSDDAPASQTSLTSAGGKCPSTQARPVDALLFNASNTARHNNVSRVRYTAVHAMPPVHAVAATVSAVACALPATSGSTTID